MAKVAIFLCFLVAFTANCGKSDISARTQVPGEDGRSRGAAAAGAADPMPQPAAYRTEIYVPRLAGERLALVVNQTSTVGGVHLVDTLQRRGLDLRKIFAPEHGFRGAADAGATIADGRDVRTGLPIRSLYGKHKQPAAADLADVDVIVFDVQDVGARFYTYISTLYYVMAAAAEHGKRVLVLDRPNPNGHVVDGPVREAAFASFVGIAPVPVLHGLTVGEFARMVNGEGWLPGGARADLSVISMRGYAHDQTYAPPVPPSPNLPNLRSIYLYPGLCFFEGTAVSVGRGTRRQFQLYGHPAFTAGDIRFTPAPGPGSANPKLNGELCRGFDLSTRPAAAYRTDRLTLDYLLTGYRQLTAAGQTFFTRPDFFDLLAGTDRLRLDILAGKDEAAIRAGWAAELAEYRAVRAKYLMYE